MGSSIAVHVVVAGTAPPAVGSTGAVCDRLRKGGLTVSRATVPGRALARVRDGRADVVVVAGGDGQGDADDTEALLEAADAEGVPACLLLPSDGSATDGQSGNATRQVVATGPDPLARLIGTVHELAAEARAGVETDPEPGDPDECQLEGAAAALPSTGRILNEAPVGITVSDMTRPDEPLVYVNDRFVDLTGYDREDALGRNCRFLQGEETRAEPVEKMRRAIDAGESVSVELRNYDADGDLFWQEVSLAPIHDESGSVTHYAGFQTDITRRKRAERAAGRHRQALIAERETLRTVLTRLEGVSEQVTRVVVEADDHDELCATVCARLADAYTGAWLGTYDPATDQIDPQWTETAALDVDPEAVVGGASLPTDDPRASPDGGSRREDGGDGATTDRAPSPAEAPELALAAEAIETGAVAARSGGSGGDHESMAAVPVTYGESVFGVACVYAAESDAFDEAERTVLASVGRTVGLGLNALDSRQSLTSDRAIEVELSLADDSVPLYALARAADCRVDLVSVIPGEDGRRVLCSVSATASDSENGETDEEPDAEARATAAADPASAVTAAAEGVEGVESVGVLADLDGEALVSLSLSDLGLFDTVGEYGLELTDLGADPTGLTLRARGSREPRARDLARHLSERYRNTELTSFRERSSRPTTTAEFVADVDGRLTERQRLALTTAHASGYFEWPRETSGKDLAAEFGVARSTFHQHLRAALGKVVGSYVNSGSAAVDGRTGGDP